MKVFLWKEKIFFNINKKEEITDNMYLVTDAEERIIKDTLEHNGRVWLTNNEIFCSGPQLSEIHIWDDTEKAWIIDTDLQNAKKEAYQENVWAAIKKKRDSQVISGVFIPSVSKIFQTDISSTATYAQIGSMISLNIYEIVNWKVLDNTFIPITEELFKELQTAILRNTQLTYAIAEQHKAAMLLSDNPEEYDYTTGWTNGVLPTE